ncbi:MAG: rane protein [Mycobacterium sp.]|nr:rane protein [Mycobacterium sp.]
MTAPPSRADEIGYLVNVTVRPGYNFATADAAVAYARNLRQDRERQVVPRARRRREG